MASLLKQSPIRLILGVIALVFAVFSVGTYCIIDVSFSQYRTPLQEEISSYFGQPVAIKSIGYSFPNFVIVRGVSLLKPYHDRHYVPIEIKSIRLRFDLLQFASRKGFRIQTIRCDDFAAVLLAYPFPIKETVQKIISLINTLPKDQAFDIAFRDASFAIPIRGNLVLYLTTDTVIKIAADKSVSGSGVVGIRHIAAYGKDARTWSATDVPEETLGYEIKSQFKKDGFIVDSLELKRDDFDLKVWGALVKDAITLNGFMFWSDFFRESPRREVRTGLFDRVRHFFKYREKLPIEYAFGSGKDLNVFDVDAKLLLGTNDVSIERMRFVANRIPCQLTGSVTFSPRVLTNLAFSLFPDELLSVGAANPRRSDFSLNAQAGDSGISGKLTAAFVKKTKAKKALHALDADFKDLTCDFPDNYRISLAFDAADVSYAIDDRSYHGELRNFTSLVNIEERQKKSFTYLADLFDGRIEGEGLVDASSMPLSGFISMRIKDVSAERIHSLSKYFCKVYGPLSAQVRFSLQPRSSITGKLIVRNGYLDRLRFFVWVADYFGLPFLEQARFDTLSADFILNDEEASLTAIDMQSPDAGLAGFFTLRDNDLVNSQLSLSLPTAKLSDSPRFRQLLAIVGEYTDIVGFDFQLSGLFDRMNFKWIESDFKHKLQKKLPSLIERIIERRLENAIGAISVPLPAQ